jgi:hypothetical protein
VKTAVVTWPLLFAPIRTQSHYVIARAGTPSFMLTDTAPLRSLDYHQRADTTDRIDYERLAIAEGALVVLVRELARSSAR